jgi:enoyl-[acyl-carrier protein] reductase I
MGFLAGKRFLITGALSSDSLAYGIAKACFREGAELAFTYQNERIARRVQKLVGEFTSVGCFPCDVANDEEIGACFNSLANHWDGLDGIVHAIAYAPTSAVNGDYLDGVNREAFQTSHDISSYSFSAMARAALPMMANRNGALLTLSYIGAHRAIPSYNMMGLAKASLEASVPYLANSLGGKGIRVNAISAGPIVTLASSGVGGFDALLKKAKECAPIGRNVTIEDVGNTAAFLLSDLSAGISGQVIYVDGGVSIK